MLMIKASKAAGLFSVCVWMVMMLLMLGGDGVRAADLARRGKRSDDVSSADLAVQHLTQQVVSNTARIADLESRMTKAQGHVAFHAEFSHDPVQLGPGADFVLDRVQTNVGNGYDHTSGRFRAPISGTYMFVVNYMGALDTYTYVHILVDGTSVDYSISHGDGATWDHVSESVVLQLRAGQTVWLQRGPADQVIKSIRGDHWTTFSGFLINADP